jgi:tRNA pseudouridine55 synthase
LDRVIAVDKPSGMSSHDVVAAIRRSSGVSKVGHAGTLDPAATGVLVVLLGRATRLAHFLLTVDKEYRGRLVLGAATDTQDSEGVVTVRADCSDVTRADVEAAFSSFEGTIEQVPPMASAVKRDGKPLYVLARQGVVVDRDPRSVTVRRFELLEFDPPNVRFEVACSKGTYVRTLAADVGTSLGCGAHLGELRRTRVGPFSIEDAHALEDIERSGRGIGELGCSMFGALPELPCLRVKGGEQETLSNGGPISVESCRIPDGVADLVRVTSDGVELLAIGKVDEPKARGASEIVVRPIRVFVGPA